MKFIILCILILTGCSTQENVDNYRTDFHMHVHSPGDFQDDMQFTGDRALIAADSEDIFRALILSNAYSSSVTQPKAVKENDFVLTQAQMHKPRLAGACAVNPLREWAVAEVERCVAKGAKVLKLHFMASGLDLKKDSDFGKAVTFLKKIERFDLTLLIHANYPKATRANELSKLTELINSFPGKRWLIGHAYGREFRELDAIKSENVFVEISIVPFWCKTEPDRKAFVEMVRKIGIKRFVFGSDWPVLHPAEMMKAFNKLPFTEEERRKILSDNSRAFDDIFE